jgi:alpha-tubulin suppressor-like RCC1 family protein
MAFGANNAGSLGVGDTINRSSPVQVGALDFWKQVCTGNSFSLILKENGSIWATGSNNVGQLGLGDTVNRSTPIMVGNLKTWVAIACGEFGLSSMVGEVSFGMSNHPNLIKIFKHNWTSDI